MTPIGTEALRLHRSGLCVLPVIAERQRDEMFAIAERFGR